MSAPWRTLKPGSIVDIIAPGFRFDPKVLARGVKQLKAWGLVPRVPTQLLGRDLICANSLEVRAKHLIQALLRKDSDAIWAIRGGYGSLQLLPELRKSPPSGPAKLLIGYSDITSLHHFLLDQWGWPSLHGPLLETLGQSKIRSADMRLLKGLLFGELEQVRVAGLRAANPAARSLKSFVRGVLTGGNLTVLQSSMGTPFQAQGRGRVVFLEEVGERGYRMDRALTQMTQAGFFKGVKAVVAGDVLGGAESHGKELGLRALRSWGENMPFPIFTGFPAGHGERQTALLMGSSCQIAPAGANFALTYKTGV
jgi:muramoyltetrapeptide carboxypeptidase